MPVTSAHAFEVKNCSIQPKLTTRDSEVYLEVLYSANVVNNTKNCIKTATVSFEVKEANYLSHSGAVNIFGCEGDAGTYKQYFALISKKKITPANYDSELQFVNKEYEKIKSVIAKSKIVCEWNPG